MIIEGRQPLLKRLPVSVDRVQGIQHYDRDNLYPQRAKETMRRSYTLSGIIEKLTGFINGEGFTDQSLASTIVFQKGQRKLTANQLLDKIAYEYAWSEGIALHVNYDLNFEVCSVSPVTFEYCRLGVPDDENNVFEIFYCTNWERDQSREPWKRKITRYHRFNPDPEVVEAQIMAAGGINNYKGQIYYWTPDDNQYPLCSFDAVFEQAQTQAEVSVFGLANVLNGFNANHILFYPGKLENEDEEKVLKKKLSEHKGAMNANTMMVIETGTSDVRGKDFLVPLTLPNNDKLWEYTANQVEKAMLQRYGMPYEILGKMPDSGMFNQQQIQEAYTYYNSVTRDRRNVVSAVFADIFQFWAGGTFADYSIVPQKYVVEASNATAAPAPTQQSAKQDPSKPVDPKAAPAPAQSNEAFKSIGEAGLNRIMKIVNRFNIGKLDPTNPKALNYDQAVQFLKGYGLTDAEIPAWLITKEEEDAE